MASVHVGLFFTPCRTDDGGIIIDFELDTRVTDECASACVTLFLAGESRQLDRGGRLGFHRSSWDAASMEEYYKDARADIGWDSLY